MALSDHMTSAIRSGATFTDESLSDAITKQFMETILDEFNNEFVLTVILYEDEELVLHVKSSAYEYHSSKTKREIIDFTKQSKMELEPTAFYNLIAKAILQVPSIKYMFSTTIDNMAHLRIMWYINTDVVREFDLEIQSLVFTPIPIQESSEMDFRQEIDELRDETTYILETLELQQKQLATLQPLAKIEENVKKELATLKEQLLQVQPLPTNNIVNVYIHTSFDLEKKIEPRTPAISIKINKKYKESILYIYSNINLRACCNYPGGGTEFPGFYPKWRIGLVECDYNAYHMPSNHNLVGTSVIKDIIAGEQEIMLYDNRAHGANDNMWGAYLHGQQIVRIEEILL